MVRGQQVVQGDELEEFYALKDVSFEVNRGDRIGIIGRNGAGKSTLLKVLSRITEPTSGRVELRGRVASLLEVGTGFHPELTGRENIFLNGAVLGMSRAEIRSKFDEIVEFAEVEKFLDTPVKRYSSGMYVRLAFAIAAHLDPEILIVDEVLAVGDHEFQKKCLGKMEDVSKGEGRTVLFVSHNMDAVSRLCERALLLEAGSVTNFGLTHEIINDYIHLSHFLEQKNLKSKVVNIDDLYAHQSGNRIKISLRYTSEIELDFPCLGFVVHDDNRNNIFGSNPTHTGAYREMNKSRSGTISATIVEPQLHDGLYFISIWFGNGKEDYFHLPYAITLQVQNMTSLEHQPSKHNNGVIIPTVQWDQTQSA